LLELLALLACCGASFAEPTQPLTFGIFLADVVGTPFENLLHRQTGRHAITWYRFGELYDGYIMFRTPIREFHGVTCVDEWIEDEADFEHFWRNVSTKQASESHSQTPFEEFKQNFCAPRPDHGAEFHERFRDLPEL